MSIHSPLPTSLPRLRPRREPLATMPISLFIPAAHTLPSPISIPSKRASSSTDIDIDDVLSQPREAKIRKAKSMGRLRDTVRDKDVTPKAKAVLERDELGTGRSPARRLFGAGAHEDDRPISGISGAISTPPSQPHRSLAPSPPIHDSPRASSSRSPFIADINLPEGSAPDLTMSYNDHNVDVHDPGFVVHADPSIATGPRTPRSRRTTTALSPAPASTPMLSLPSSPASSSSHLLENQENIPPLSATVPYSPSKGNKSRSHSVHSTPSKHSSSYDESDISAYLSAPSTSTSTSASGSGTRRRERSKLMNEVMSLRGEMAGIARDSGAGAGAAQEDEEGEGEELTPGRKVLEKGIGRQRLLGEVDAV